ncbi:MAG: hypothetical protein O7B99_01455 [Planctomycetota bacterium]|nr:hypothetical protein [Planctomycetota bacterium]
MRPLRALILGLSLLLVASCREGTESETGAGGGSSSSITPAVNGAHGCNGPDQAFAPPQTPSEIALAVLDIGPFSRIAAATAEEKLYATGENGQVVELDFTGGGLVETELVTPGFVTTLLDVGVPGPAELSGVGVLQANLLIVMEHASNTLFQVGTGGVDMVAAFAGDQSVMPGYADGPTALARFHFLAPGDVTPTGDGRIFVADTGNHRVRVIDVGLSVVFTAAGTGIAASIDGDIVLAGFDTPWGISVSCADQLILTESGDVGGTGNRLRAVTLGFDLFFGFPTGATFTLAGDGVPATFEGVGLAASLARPSPAVTTSQGDVYWVDTLTGVLRRYDFSSQLADCPLAVDCATAVGAPAFSATGGNFSLAVAASGDLYVLDADAEKLFRIP